MVLRTLITNGQNMAEARRGDLGDQASAAFQQEINIALAAIPRVNSRTATVNFRFSRPIVATVIAPFASFQKGQNIVIDRFAAKAKMVGVEGKQEFLPHMNVDEDARREIIRQYNLSLRH